MKKSFCLFVLRYIVQNVYRQIWSFCEDLIITHWNADLSAENWTQLWYCFSTTHLNSWRAVDLRNFASCKQPWCNIVQRGLSAFSLKPLKISIWNFQYSTHMAICYNKVLIGLPWNICFHVKYLSEIFCMKKTFLPFRFHKQNMYRWIGNCFLKNLVYITLYVCETFRFNT